MKTVLQLGSTLDTLDRGELRSELALQTQDELRQLARSCKYLRLPNTSMAVASTAASLDGSGAGLGPRDGFIWTIRRLAISGLTTGATPDVVRVFRDSPTGIPVWEINGNNWSYTFGKCELLLLGGETLSFASVGVINAAGPLTISGDLLEVAAEEIFKLF